MAINKTIFDKNWKTIRSQSTARWNLMAEYDLVKVDKADVKLDKFVTMLQVKYGYTRPQAREQVNRLWTENELKARLLNKTK
ncbi:MAG TPA: hypothetical protein VJ972_15735 [Anaerolineales bacterium]|nr:hypothetical protein [Anaerolineales bacterium]